MNLVDFCLGGTPWQRCHINTAPKEYFEVSPKDDDDDRTMNQSVVELLFKYVLTGIFFNGSDNENRYGESGRMDEGTRARTFPVNFSDLKISIMNNIISPGILSFINYNIGVTTLRPVPFLAL